MAELEFTWNPAKAAANKRKHRVSFGEDTIRIISARKAIPSERLIYDKRRNR